MGAVFVAERSDDQFRMEVALKALAGAPGLRMLDLSGAELEDGGLAAIAEGSVSITPIKIDLTDHARVAPLSDWLRKRT